MRPVNAYQRVFGRRRRLLALVVVACGAASCSTTAGAPQSVATKPPAVRGPLVGPRTTVAEDTEYYQDLARVDPAIATYVQAYGNTALRALLTDGSGFCALIKRYRQVDTALVEFAIGVRSVDASTHLPISAATLNGIEGVALVRLCPSLIAGLPSDTRAKIVALRAELGG